MVFKVVLVILRQAKISINNRFGLLVQVILVGAYKVLDTKGNVGVPPGVDRQGFIRSVVVLDAKCNHRRIDGSKTKKGGESLVP